MDIPDHMTLKWTPPSPGKEHPVYEVIDMGETRKRSLTSGRVTSKTDETGTAALRNERGSSPSEPQSASENPNKYYYKKTSSPAKNRS